MAEIAGGFPSYSAISLYIDALNPFPSIPRFFQERFFNYTKEFEAFKKGLGNINFSVSKEDPKSFLHELQKSLKLQGEVALHIPKCILQKQERYKILKSFIANNQETAKKIPIDDPKLKNWIFSDLIDRKFAAYYNLEAPPPKYCNLPKGAVVLTTPSTYLASRFLSNQKFCMQKLIFKIKAWIARLFFQEPYTHAQLMLNGGVSFDLKKKHCFQKYSHEIELIERKPNETCFLKVFVLNPEKIKEETGEDFETLWPQIEQKARDVTPQIAPSDTDIIRTLFPIPRPVNYDATRWDPKQDRMGCSGTISALFGSFGIDIGKEFNRKHDNVRPSHFAKSQFFKPYDANS